METSFLSVLPNLSIGVVSVLALAYLSLRHALTQKEAQDKFVKTLDDRADKHEKAMLEREQALRSVESEVRRNLTDQLVQNTVALKGNSDAFSNSTRLMERIIRHLDGEKM